MAQAEHVRISADNSLFWDEVSRHCHMSRDYTKRCAYALQYGGSIDPWLDAIIREAIRKTVRGVSPYAKR